MPEFQINLNILGYREDEEHVALALEMDLRGYGTTFEEALQDLAEQVMMQLGFSLQKYDNFDMAFRSAEPIWFERFADARREALHTLKPDPNADFHITGMPVPPAHVIQGMKDQFALNA